MKVANPVGTNFCSHSMDDMKPGMEGWVEIDHIVEKLSLKIKSHSCGRSFHGTVDLVDGYRAGEDGRPGWSHFLRP